MNGNILIEKVMNAGLYFDQLLAELDTAQKRTALAKSKVKDYTEALGKAIEGGEVPEEDAQVLESGLRDLIAIERFGSLSSLFLTYKMTVGELRALMTKTFQSLTEPLNLGLVQQSMQALSVDSIKEEARRSTLSTWESLNIVSVFQTLNPQNFITSILSQVETKQAEIRAKEEPKLIQSTPLTCSGLL